jgi:DNA-binding transcriptional regulator GbsR (MarR family)
MAAQSNRSHTLSEKELSFIEKNGQHYEKTYGIARIGGRILGLLMIQATPITIEEIGSTLGVSHGSISTNLRLLTLMGLVEKVTFPGDRCDYYQFSPDAWEEILNKRLKCILELRNLAYGALADLDPLGVVCQRFEEMASWADLAARKYHELLAEWKKFQEEMDKQSPQDIFRIETQYRRQGGTAKKEADREET